MSSSSTPRVVVYHQEHGHGDTFVPLLPMVDSGNLTHLILAAVHITDDGVVTLNDHPHDDPHHEQLWAEAAQVQERGVPVMVMVGGWAPGTMCKLDGDDFDTYYPALRDFLRAHAIQGVDIDVEQDMSLDGVIRLIDQLRADFGSEFDIILAPVASAMWGGDNLSGFDYEELYRRRGEQIDWVQIQFYSGYGSLEDTRDVQRIIDRGVYPVDKLVLGVVGHPEDAHGYVDIDRQCATLSQIAATYPNIGGVDVWEYYRALPGDAAAPWEWIDRVHDALVHGADRINALGLIPTPSSVVRGEGSYTLPRVAAVSGEEKAIRALDIAVGPGAGLVLVPGDDAQVRLIDDPALPDEAYRLVVDADGVTIAASDVAGFWTAGATLRQLLPAWVNGPAPVPGAALELPFVTIEDAPRFSWRGVHLDVARHFQPLPFLYRFIDQLAALKLNVLHLHLTDDQGWRFEVDGYPELVRTASWRAHTHNPAWETNDGQPHGGYYTQDQLRALVGYAQARGVMIVPEVDLPGHVRSLLAAYPQFGDPGATEVKPVAPNFGVFDEVLHLTDETMEMVEAIFTQLLDVFPYSYWIHIGGDECPKTQWVNSPAAAELAETRGVDGPGELQRWFTERMRAWLAERSRGAVAWDEVIEEHEAPGTLIMSWRGHEPGIKALQQGNDAVMCTWGYTYLDQYQSTDETEPYAIGGGITWQKVLGYDPAMGVPDDVPGRLLGVQAQLWTEYMPTERQVEYMAFPRVAALAEIGWATTKASEGDFFARLVQAGHRWDAAGLNHRPVGGAMPWQHGGEGLRRRPDEHRG
ncbi:family 20 glycosylhydrolase [Tessaracoccus caeni]|uniref:family 20 glycosylhydrolase n=1 Tax=Tessaracoccus caeni TaxID=3031239 RepID=UPI0023DBAF25|nr:family 20 glycosylhydrolase [Tessaracoccus caeni]MDF1488859.1 family 20 glycosylhydrolase [Tessaracoccus caeni]